VRDPQLESRDLTKVLLVGIESQDRAEIEVEQLPMRVQPQVIRISLCQEVRRLFLLRTKGKAFVPFFRLHRNLPIETGAGAARGEQQRPDGECEAQQAPPAASSSSTRMLALLAVPSWTAGWQQRYAPRSPSRCAAFSRAPPLLLQVLDPDDNDEETSPEKMDAIWRVDRARLNEQWSASIMKRRPRFLPFDAARQWARAMHLETEDDWREWIADGEKRNPYVPSKPDEVYSDSGWLGFHDFLNGPIEDLSTLLKPGYKRGKWLRGPLADMPRGDEDT